MTAFESTLLTLCPEFTFLLNDASGNLVNAGTGADFTGVASAPTYRNTSGVPNGTDYSVGLDGTDDAFTAASLGEAYTEGSVVFLFKRTADTGSTMLYSMLNGSAPYDNVWFVLSDTGIQVRVSDSSTTDYASMGIANSTFNDGGWHDLEAEFVKHLIPFLIV